MLFNTCTLKKGDVYGKCAFKVCAFFEDHILGFKRYWNINIQVHVKKRERAFIRLGPFIRISIAEVQYLYPYYEVLYSAVCTDL